MPKPLWIRVEGGRQLTVGEVSFEPKPEEGVRLIRTTPNPGIKPYHSTFSWLISDLHKEGYTPKLNPNGSIELELPLSDKFGHILSKIAWTYRRAMGVRRYG
jgi:hypothetical protein